MQTGLTTRVIGIGRAAKGRKERDFLVDLSTLRTVNQYLSHRGQDEIPALFLSNSNVGASNQALNSTYVRMPGVGASGCHGFIPTNAGRPSLAA